METIAITGTASRPNKKNRYCSMKLMARYEKKLSRATTHTKRFGSEEFLPTARWLISKTISTIIALVGNTLVLLGLARNYSSESRPLAKATWCSPSVNQKK